MPTRALENVSGVIRESLSQLDGNVRRKIDRLVIALNWRELVGDDADEIFPVDIKGTTLTLFSNNSALKDRFKYRAPKLIAEINSRFGGEVVTNINFSATLLNKLPIEKSPAQEENSPREVEITLTEDELEDCRKKAAVIENEERQRMLFDCLVAKKKSDKAKTLSNWHKCAACENLCPPQENLCDVCKVYERNKMTQAIRKIFHDAPYTKFRDVQLKIFETMPHMKAECTLSFIESARMALIQQTVRRISFGDRESPLVKFLVMLVRQLPEESLTEKIIERTLHEFRFDFPDRPILQPKNFKKLNAAIFQPVAGS